MKTRKEKKTVKGFKILKTNELLQIRGGTEGAPTGNDNDFD